MNNLTIILNNITEIVNCNLIHKLYLEVLNSNNHNISGVLNVDKCYQSEADYLRTSCPNLVINVTSGYYIPFVDDAVKNTLATQIGDGTGVTQSDIDSVNNNQINIDLSGNTTIEYFPEMYLFLPRVKLTNCSNLKEISFGSSTTNTERQYSFEGCNSLNKITIHNLTDYYNIISGNYNPSYENWTNCNSLNKDYYDKNGNLITNLRIGFDEDGCVAPQYLRNWANMNAFERSTITSLTVGPNLIKLGGFANCKSLSSIDFTNATSLTQIDTNCFSGCSNLVINFDNLPLTITSLSIRAFKSCKSYTGTVDLPNLTSVYLPFRDTNMNGIGIRNLGQLTNPGDLYLGGSTVKFLVLPATLQSLGYLGAVLQYSKCLATVPPTLNGGVDGNIKNKPLYVPDDSVSAYQNANKWSDFATIKPLSDFAADKVANNWDE